MRSIYTILLIAITIAVVKSEIKFFADRSADIIVENPLMQQNSMLFVKGNVFDSASLASIKDTQLATLISHVMGTLSLNSESRTGFPKVSLFNKPKLNLFFSMNSVNSADLKDTLTFIKKDSVINVDKSFYPMDSVAELTTLAAGVTPEEHGIVGASWMNENGKKVNAYSTGANSRSLKANVADVFSQTFKGQSLILTASSSQQFVAATGVHAQAKFAHGNSFEYDTTQSASETESMLYTSEFTKFFLPSGWTAKLSNGELTINNGEVSIVVSIDQAATKAFLSELAFLARTTKNLTKKGAFNGAVSDSVPDLFSFNFASMTALRGKPFFAFAVAMADQAMQSTYEQLSGLYGGRVACELVIMPAVAPVDEALHKIVRDSVSVHIASADLPNIYLKSYSKAQRQEICSKVEQSVDSSNKVHCVQGHSKTTIIDDGGAGNGSTPPPPSTLANTNKVAAFQIFLFFPIFWVLFAIAGIILMMGISADAQKDTLLYRAARRNA
eukprot:gene17930-21388_t